jgi:serine/threonine protein phosphatase PrpC
VPADGSGAPSAIGSYQPYALGDPGRAFTRAAALLEAKHRDCHDIVIDAATINDPEGTPRLVVRAASSRGLAHQQYGDPRQDDHCILLSADGEWLVALVADGVSAGEWSHLAAKVVTEEGAAEVAKLLATTDPGEIGWRSVFERLADLMHALCATLPSDQPADVDLTARQVAEKMATTLVVAVVATRPAEDGTHDVTVVRIGDSSAWIVDSEEGWISLGDVKNAGNVIAESATACLPLVPDTDPVVVETTLGDGAALALITDGIGDPLGSGQGEVGRELARLWARPPHPVDFAGQVAFGRKTYDDDRGAVVVWLAE